MNSEGPQPLWREVVGDTEPWRRGRMFLILLGTLTFLLQGLVLGVSLVVGDLERLLVMGIFVLLFWLQYYFIWIGVHWVRWLSGAWNALAGFAYVIWGLRDQAIVLVAIGIYLFGIGAYLALAPSVYFFAKRQRESIRWTESLFVAAIFLLLFGSLGAGVFGLLGYRVRLQREAHRFADEAFHSIFTEHDTYFLLDHASDRLKKVAGGREKLTRFLQDATIHAGDVHDTQRATGLLRLAFSFPGRLSSEGEMIAKGTGEHGPIQMRMVVGKTGGTWEIHNIAWTDLTRVPKRSGR